ncbi:amino acid ABC transporter permease [Falsirhodobacter algicola]|uniref:ABC transporter permease subunit n=1 Tax=Falsirhodobacter algicola TaxID=2692330 RepID=A0A8J8MUQ5_9RHOB|nr:ABC transporter permease subunit [Falsirhodobacter algicola]QUS36588.1 ABC transporter permease subunit [Falsirhodobacter algicola]
MADAVEKPKESFRLSMLIYDTRYRSMTIQLVVFALFVAIAAWLVDNTVRNLAALGKDFDFGFLSVRAGYDIAQRLVPYTQDSTHLRALIVGLMNTLLIAVMGCALATVVGIAVGVLRLSSNWLVARLMTVYVEMFRNVPILLWILLFYTVFTEASPAPSVFRGDEGRGLLFGLFAVTNRYTAIPAIGVDNGFGSLDLGLFPVNLSLLAVVVVLAISLFVRSRLNRHAAAIQAETGRRPVTWWKSLLIVVLPLVILLWVMGVHLLVPTISGFNFTGGVNVPNSFMALWLALSLYTGAFIAEIVRAGILAVSRGQSEAAFALGLRPGRTMSLVILPQALRVIIPPLISQFLNLTKNSSLAIAVGYLDLRGTLGGITLNQTGRELECVLLMMLIYLAISLVISAVMNVYNSRVRLKER